MTWLVDPLRRLRQGRVALAGVALLVAITVFAAVAGPRLYERVSGESIRSAVLAIPPADRVVQLSEVDTGLPSQPRTFKDQSSAGAAVAHLFPGPLPAILGSAVTIVETPSTRVVEGTSLAAELRLRIMEGASDHIHLVGGRASTGAVTFVPDPLHSGGSGDGQAPATIPQFEAEISNVAADKLGLAPGAVLVLAPDPLLDPLAGGGAVGVTITGIFEVDSATDPYWTDDARVRGYTLREFSSNVTFVQTTLLLSPDAYGPLAFGTAMHGPSSGGYTIAQPALRVSWRYAADPSRIDPADLDPIVSALRRLQATYPILPLNASSPSIQTGLLRRLVGLQAPWGAAGALLALSTIGAAMVAFACLGLVIALGADERRRIVVIQRERGSSALQAVAGGVVEALVTVLPGAVLGVFLATWLLPRGDVGLSLVAAAGIAITVAAMEVTPTIRAVAGPPRLLARAPRVARSVGPRRLVLEAVVVGVTVAGAAMLRGRGLQAGTPGPAAGTVGSGPTTLAGTTGPDPFLAIVPVLVGLAAGIIALRIVPVLLSALAWLAARRPGLGAVLSARRAARGPGASRVLLIVLAIATLGGFASATISGLDGSADLQAWQDVGAAYRIDASTDWLGSGTVLPPELVSASLPGVRSAIPAHIGRISLSTGGQRELVALDASRYAALLDGSPIALDVTADLLRPPTPGAAGGSGPAPGTPEDPLPAVLSSGSVGAYRSLAVGDVFRIATATKPVTFRVVELLDTFPGMPAGTPFVIVSWPAVDAVAPGGLVGTTSLYLDAPPAASASLEAVAHAVSPQAVVSSQAAEAATLGSQGVVQVVSAGVVVLAGVALLYAALAIIAAFALTAAARADETAQLTTLGLSDRQSRSMLFVEFGPPVVLAVMAGWALGLGLFSYLAPGLGLAAILGVLVTASPSVDALQLGLLAVLIGGILWLGVALGALAQRRAAWAAIRRGTG